MAHWTANSRTDQVGALTLWAVDLPVTVHSRLSRAFGSLMGNSADWCSCGLLCLLLKKSMSKWSHTIQTHEVQGSAVNTLTLTFPDLFLKAWLDWAVGKCSRAGEENSRQALCGASRLCANEQKPKGWGLSFEWPLRAPRCESPSPDCPRGPRTWIQALLS